MRKSGILMHLSSLSSPYGIGTLGKDAYDFVRFLKKSGQSYWQMLPICPTGYGDSPYQSYSAFAGNPYFIDLERLEELGLLEKADYRDVDWESTADKVNYGALYEKRYPILQEAVRKFLKEPFDDYDTFCTKNEFWLSDYASFMSLKESHGGVNWNKDEWKALQYLFFKQWFELKSYANQNGILIIGDLPIYVSLDSADVWAHPELFQLNEEGRPTEVAGVPPDGFSADGQLWGNPLYNWDYLEKTGFSWWIQRIEYLCKVYDVLRIDHFRGFDSYFAIPYGEQTAKNGHWRRGPGMKLFDAIERAIGTAPIIAEDLGYLTDSVKDLLKKSGFPGMKILEFAFDSRDEDSSEHLPHKYVPNCVAYTGTHDNDTILGWFEDASLADVAYCKEYLDISEGDKLNWSIMNALWRSVANLTIVQAQDILGLGSEARMNRPGTVGNNWKWRAAKGAFTEELAEKIKRKMEIYDRII